jgi:transcriptional regulator with XRE-family HTH domain
MDAPDNILGRRLASLRKARKVRQIDVARYLNISRQAISKYELGTREPDVATLRKLAEYYGASTDYLLGVKDKDEDKSDKLDQTTVHRFLSSLEVAENIMARNPKDVETTDNKESVADPTNS